MKKLLFIILLPLFITGCWDKVEIENRGFVIAMGIDKFGDDDEGKAIQLNGKTDPPSSDSEDRSSTKKWETDHSKPKESESDHSDAKKTKSNHANSGESESGNANSKKSESDSSSASSDTSAPKASIRPEARYTVTMALPDVGALMGTGASEDGEFIKTVAAPTVSEAIRLIDTFSSERLYFGHTKAIIFSEEVLKDENLFREALDAIERNRELSRNLLVLATFDDMNAILNAKIPGEPLIGAFIADFYRKSEGAAITFKQDLEGLTRRLRSESNAMIPILSLEGGKEDAQIKLGGTAIIKDFRLSGKLNDSQTRAFMWFYGKAKGALITSEHEGIDVPMRISSSKSKTSFYEDNGRIRCLLDISLQAEVEEFDFLGVGLNEDNALRELSLISQNIISDEITQLFTLFRDELNVDGFGLCERLRKQDDILYARYGDEAYSLMTLVPRVHLEITGAGVILSQHKRYTNYR